MFNLHTIYNYAMRPLLVRMTSHHVTHAQNKRIAALADVLLNTSIAHELSELEATLAEDFAGAIPRDFCNPTDFTSPSVCNKPWSDSDHAPFIGNQKWNTGRRATASGVLYTIGEDGLPINPYYNYGIKGRGYVGAYGPNHAVDIGALRMMPNHKGEMRLHALGIIRKDNNRPALAGGFVEFPCTPDTTPVYDHVTCTRTQAHEFFEEMISGSIELEPFYVEGLDDCIFETISRYEYSEEITLSAQRKSAIAAQITTSRKLQQVYDRDPGFVTRLHHMFDNAPVTFQGPVMSTGRNTNTSWMETKLSSFMFSEEKEKWLTGNNPRYNYAFNAGDDAEAVLWHEISASMMQETESHGLFLGTLLCDALISCPPHEKEILRLLITQAEEIVDTMSAQRKTLEYQHFVP